MTQHDTLAVHATPRSDEEILRPETPDAEASEMVAGVTAGLLAFVVAIAVIVDVLAGDFISSIVRTFANFAG